MATLSVTINESITLNGRERGSEINLDITSITQVMQRIVSLPADGGVGPATQTTIANFRTAVTTADSAMDDDDVKYIRVTNLDSSNNVHLSLQLAANGDAVASTQASILLEAGKSFLLGKAVGIAAVDDDDEAATALGSLVDLESIIAVNDNNADVDVEVFVASA
jgi:hypothetical protein|tara:strand:- start:706 stop:1200 length:495 start_codon:yes stop_codon:yes gene_type:complete